MNDATITLSDDEAHVAECAEAGRPADFIHQVVDGIPTAIIRASVLRSFLLGVPIHFPHQGSPRSVKITYKGIYLLNAQIDGPIDLEDACSADGTSLAPLMLERCLIPTPVNLARARLRYLSLKGSRITHLYAKDIVVEGPIDLSFVSTAETDDSGSGSNKRGLCWVELVGARVQGGVEGGGAKLVAPPQRSGYLRESFSVTFRYALDLREAAIGGSIILRPDTSLEGGLSLRGTEVRGDVTADGGRLTAIEGFAFDGSNAVVRGNVKFRSYDDPDQSKDTVPFRAFGEVRVHGAKIAGDLQVTGAILKGAEGGMALDGQDVEIGGHCFLRNQSARRSGEKHTFRFVAKGEVCLLGAKIGGGLSMSSAHLFRSQGGRTLNAAYARVGMNCWLNAVGGKRGGKDYTFQFRTSGEVNLGGAKIVGYFDARGARLLAPTETQALNLQDTEIGKDCYLCTQDGKQLGTEHTFQFEASGSVNLVGAKIGGDLAASAAKLLTTDRTLALNLQNAEIGKNCFLCTQDGRQLGAEHTFRFEASGGVNLMGCKIRSDLDLSGAKLLAAVGTRALNLASAEIGSYCHLSRRHFPFEANEEVSLWGAKIGGSLHIEGANLGRFTATNLEIKEDLRLTSVSVDSHSLWYLVGARVGHQFRVTDLQAEREARADLRHLTVGQLSDAGGRGWGHKVRLQLDGFRYERLDEQPPPSPWSLWQVVRSMAIQALKEGARASFLRGMLLISAAGNGAKAVSQERRWWRHPKRLYRVVADAAKPAWGRRKKWLSAKRSFEEAARNAKDMWKGRSFWFEYERKTSEDSEPAWEKRIGWLNLQYPEKIATKRDYRPDPYEQLARTYRAAGRYDEARRITSHRLTIERKFKPLPIQGLLILFSWFFDYGLSPRRALTTFALCLGLGWFAFYVADRGLNLVLPNDPVMRHVFPAMPRRLAVVPSLVVNTGALDTVALERVVPSNSSKDLKVPAVPVSVDGKSVTDEELNCGAEIDPKLYALEVFVPGFSLQQQNYCRISPQDRAVWWRLFKALYSALGWIVTSLTLLTVTGILRRHLEQ